MKAILSVAFLGAVAAAASVQDNKLHFGDSCVAYHRSAANTMVMSLVDCKDATEFVWNSAVQKFETTVSGNVLCVPQALTTCAVTAPAPIIPQPPMCQVTSCRYGEVFNMHKCRCEPEYRPEPEKPHCKKHCPPGQVLASNDICECVPKYPLPTCKKMCPEGMNLSPYAPCECVPKVY